MSAVSQCFASLFRFPVQPNCRCRWSSYLIAVVLVAVAFGIRHSIGPLIGEHAIFILFVPAIMLSAWLGGIGPGISSVGLSLVLASTFFSAPWHFWSPSHLLALSSYLFSVILIVGWTNALRSHAEKLEREVEYRRHLETELRNSEYRFRQVFEAAAVGIVQLDPSGGFIAANAKFCQLLGYQWNEIRRHKMFDFVFHEDRAADITIFQQTACGEIPVYEREKRYVRKDGAIVWVHVAATSLRDNDGKPQASISVIEEITARIKAEGELRDRTQHLAIHAVELERRVEQRTLALRNSLNDMENFCYSIAHDLRAPLRAMIGFADLLRDDYQDELDKEGRAYCTRIVEASQRMDRMILALLEYGRVAHLLPTIQRLDLQEEINKALEDCADMVRERNATVAVDSVDGTICANPVLFAQALRNLLSNALKFVPPETTPRIRIFASSKNQRARIFVQDNGIGIEPEHRDKIFGPFQRLHRSDEFPGTGIGLSLARKSVEKMGGKIGVDSEPGIGSTFWIELSSHAVCPCDERLCAALSADISTPAYRRSQTEEAVVI